MNPSQHYTPSCVYSVSVADTWQYSFSKPLTGAAHFFKEGTGQASFNSKSVDSYRLATRTRDCYFLLLRSLLVHFSWRKTITTANDRRTVYVFKCVDSSMVLHCIMCKYRPMVMYISGRESFYDLIELHLEEGFTKQRASVDIHHLNVTSP